MYRNVEKMFLTKKEKILNSSHVMNENRDKSSEENSDSQNLNEEKSC